MDFNIIIRQNNECDKEEDIQKKIEHARKWGYKTVALNTIIQLSAKEEIPEPLTLEVDERKREVLTRITGVVNTDAECYAFMQSGACKKYDIISLQPTNEKVFYHICENLNVDIIALDFERLPFSAKTNQVKQVAQKGMHFEINYVKLLKGGSCRTWAISKGRNLVSSGSKSNLIVSSGATNYMDIRAVDDVIHLGLVFGLSVSETRQCLITNTKMVLKHAGIKKTGKAVISVLAVNQLNAAEKWLVEASDVNNYIKANKISDLNSDVKHKITESDDGSSKKVKLDVNC